MVYIQDNWFAFCPTTTYDTERNEFRITDAKQWYEEINYNYLIDSKTEMCGWMKRDRILTRIRVKEVINPIDLLVEIVTTGEIVNTTVLNVKQIREEHVLPRVSSMKCKLFDVLVSEEHQRFFLNFFKEYNASISLMTNCPLEIKF